MENFKIQAIFCDCTDRFMLDLVGNPEGGFSCVKAQVILLFWLFWKISLIAKLSENNNWKLAET